ncbi:MAG: hypothetical protein N2C14_02815, partial [Planctomycetales bacterium]
MNTWDAEIKKALGRALHVTGGQKTPLRWAAVLPSQPFANLVDRDACFELHQQLLKPDLIARTIPGGTLSVSTSEQGDTFIQNGVSCLTFTGMIFSSEYASETRRGRHVEFQYTREFFEKLFLAAKEL